MVLVQNHHESWRQLWHLNICFHSLTRFFYGSGEKAETSEWPAMVEVKRRVRLSGFGKFIQELPKSRTRALMVYKAFFCYHCTSITLNNLLLHTTLEVTLLLLLYIIFNHLTLSHLKTLLSSLHGNQKAKRLQLNTSHVCVTGMGTRFMYAEHQLYRFGSNFVLNPTKEKGCQFSFIMSLYMSFCVCGGHIE